MSCFQSILDFFSGERKTDVLLEKLESNPNMILTLILRGIQNGVKEYEGKYI